MKSFKLLAAGVLAASSLVSAFAADLGTVYITGSSAFRVATVNAISGLYVPSTLQVGSVGSLTGSTYAIWKGTLVSTGDTVTICTSFNGSAAGVQAIVQTTTGGIAGNPANVPAIAYIDPAISLAPAPSATTALTLGAYTHSSDIALSDVRVELTPFRRATDLAAIESPNSPVGVIPFYWVKNNGANAAINNVTHQMVKAAAANSLRLSFFTGVDADTTAVRIVGRNPDSGTRLTAFEEAGFGALSTATQFLPSGATQTTAGSGDITSFSLWPAETVLGISFGVGQSGYASGSTLRDVMKRTSSAGAIITYLGLSDATNAVSGGATILPYNGVTPDTAAPWTTFVSGKYSFWSFEHLFYNETASDAVIQIGDEIAQEIKDNQAAGSGIPVGLMNVKRSGEGKVIIHK